MCGVKTHIVTSVEATAYESGDSTQLIPLLNKTAETFRINEVSADKAYSSRQNLHAIENAGVEQPTFPSRVMLEAWEAPQLAMTACGIKCGTSTTLTKRFLWLTTTRGLMSSPRLA